MKYRHLCFCIVFSVSASLAHAGCTDADVKSFRTEWLAFIKALLASDVPCPSARTVLNKLAYSRPVGGRKLEDDRPFNAIQAEQNLAAALKDDEIRQKFVEADKTLSDENARLAYKAAILDDGGFYFARDLKIRELEARLK